MDTLTFNRDSSSLKSDMPCILRPRISLHISMVAKLIMLLFVGIAISCRSNASPYILVIEPGTQKKENA